MATLTGNSGENKYDKQRHIEPMIRILRDEQVRQKVTFPVRAVLAQNSYSELDHLLTFKFGASTGSLTIWSSPGDSVDFDKIVQVILRLGKDRIYLDVPADQDKEIRKRI